MEVNILYWGRACNVFRPKGRRDEIHPYAQLEICARGRIAVRGNDGTITLTAGDCLLIPPGIRHNCLYPCHDNEFYSLKFETSPLPEQFSLCKADDFTRWFLTSLRGCHQPEQQLAMPLNDSNREILTGITGMMLAHILHPAASRRTDAEPPVFTEIRDAVLSCGEYINVENCAELLGTDAEKLHYRFAKALKTFDLSPRDYSVKKLIDEAIVSQINQYLDFTELTISGIAEQMKFNNIYTFSRFYSRLEGYSPRERRRKNSAAT